MAQYALENVVCSDTGSSFELRCDGDGIPVCGASSSSGSDSSISDSESSISFVSSEGPSTSEESSNILFVECDSSAGPSEEFASSDFQSESSNVIFAECESSAALNVEFYNCEDDMPIVLTSDDAGDAQVILKDGVCYYRVGVTQDPVDTGVYDQQFEDCAECESRTSAEPASEESAQDASGSDDSTSEVSSESEFSSGSSQPSSDGSSIDCSEICVTGAVWQVDSGLGFRLVDRDGVYEYSLTGAWAGNVVPEGWVWGGGLGIIAWNGAEWELRAYDGVSFPGCYHQWLNSAPTSDCPPTSGWVAGYPDSVPPGVPLFCTGGSGYDDVIDEGPPTLTYGACASSQQDISSEEISSGRPSSDTPSSDGTSSEIGSSERDTSSTAPSEGGSSGGDSSEDTSSEGSDGGSSATELSSQVDVSSEQAVSSAQDVSSATVSSQVAEEEEGVSSAGSESDISGPSLQDGSVCAEIGCNGCGAIYVNQDFDNFDIPGCDTFTTTEVIEAFFSPAQLAAFCAGNGNYCGIVPEERVSLNLGLTFCEDEGIPENNDARTVFWVCCGCEEV